MLLPVLLLVIAPTLLPAATVQTAAAALVHRGPTCSRLTEASVSPGAGGSTWLAAGDGGARHVPAAYLDSSVAPGALPSIRGVSQLVDSRPAVAPAQTPQTTTPAPTEPPTADNPTGTGLERWQATVVAVVAAGALVWLVGRVRRMGRKG